MGGVSLSIRSQFGRVIPPTVARVVHNVIGLERYPVKVGFRPP